MLNTGKATNTQKGANNTMIIQLSVTAPRQGLHEITQELNQAIHTQSIETGLCTTFIQHTSASLLIQENADPRAQRDLEQWLNKLVPVNDPAYTHTDEGPEDMPSHIKSMLTSSSVAIPIINSCLALGTWQGIFLWEHRHNSGPRNLILHLQNN